MSLPAPSAAKNQPKKDASAITKRTFAQTKEKRSAAPDSPNSDLPHLFLRAARPVIFSRRIPWRPGTGLSALTARKCSIGHGPFLTSLWEVLAGSERHRPLASA